MKRPLETLDLKMKIEDGLRREMESDLGLNVRFEKGQIIPVRNCWHFSTNGNLVDFLFRDVEDFIAGVNRIFVLLLKYRVIVLAFSLMDTHVHFVLWGDFHKCELFMHEYLKLTSMYISRKYGDRHKLENVSPDYQVVDTDGYLKTVICYVLKNAPVGGIPFNALDYPWSSAPLYFRRPGFWSSLDWESMLTDSSELGVKEICRVLNTRVKIKKSFKMIGGMVFPGEFVAVETVEKIFRTHKSFNYFMCVSKESDVESVYGSISRLSIPNSELHQHKKELCLEKYGVDTIRTLSTDQRLALARMLRAKYNCSPKQIVKVCGLCYPEVKSML